MECLSCKYDLAGLSEPRCPECGRAFDPAVRASYGPPVRKVRKGERYRSMAPLQVSVLTSWAAPCTGGGEAVLPAGEVFVVAGNPPTGATAVYCDPVRYEQLHAHFVPESDRGSAKYRGYYLAIRLNLIAEMCERVTA